MKPHKRGFKHYYLKGLLDVDPITGCWIWLGRQSQGYGRIDIRKPNGSHTTTTVQRWFYELYVGSIPAHLDAGHKCHRRCCANPRHLEAQTRLANTQEWWIDQRFTSEQKEEVCQMMAADLPISVIADRMCAPRPYISRLVARMNWEKHQTSFDIEDFA